MGTQIVRHVLIDGDYIVYAAGFAGQKTEYAYLPPEGAVLCSYSIAEIQEQLGGNSLDRANLFARTYTDPPAHVFHSAKIMLQKIMRKCEAKYPRDALQYHVYIDGDGNFRQKLATIRPYKALRGDRPILYHDLREYLRRQWDAKLVHDQETDDAISIVAHEGARRGVAPIIVAVDKDLLQIPGIHYNPNKGWTKISPELGEILLYRQCLTGDATDNIAGCYRVGKETAKKLIGPGLSEELKWSIVVGAYQKSIDHYGVSIYNGLTAEEAAVENMQLVYLRTRPDEIWVPPGERAEQDVA